MLSCDITDKELITVTAGAESLLSSRPLNYQTANVKDDVLLRNHFLQGKMGGHFAQEAADTSRFNPQKRQCKVQESLKCGPDG